MKSTFSTQSPFTPRTSNRYSDEQGETARYGTTMEHMTARETGTIDRAIYDTINDTINLKRRHETGYQADADATYIIEIEKLPANLHERRGGKPDDIGSDG